LKEKEPLRGTNRKEVEKNTERGGTPKTHEMALPRPGCSSGSQIPERKKYFVSTFYQPKEEMGRTERPGKGGREGGKPHVYCGGCPTVKEIREESITGKPRKRGVAHKNKRKKAQQPAGEAGTHVQQWEMGRPQ